VKKSQKEKKTSEIKLIKRKLACENQVFNIYFDNIEAKNGLVVNKYLVVSPKVQSSNNVSGVGILPCRNGHVGLIKIYRHPAGISTWEIPRGFLDPNENPLASAIRELKEETGINCSEKMMVSLGTILPEPGVFCARVYLYAAINCETFNVFSCDEIGHQEFSWFSFEKLQTMVKENDIEDATTLSAIFRFNLIDKDNK